MAETNWLQIGIASAASLLGGGAMGALIRQFIDERHNRVQPVEFCVSHISIFGITDDNEPTHLRIAVERGNSCKVFDNAAIVQLEIENAGRRDFDQFHFGLALPAGARAIHVKCRHADSQNKLETADVCTPDFPQVELTFVARPFNRRRTVYVQMIVICDHILDISKIELSSPSPVAFVEARNGGQFCIWGMGLDINGQIRL